ncbi:MAG: hypothetical protein NC115_01815 [Bacteroidales bacterium]|nr:hypothetical protein [Bacteroidales bacterium]
MDTRKSMTAILASAVVAVWGMVLVKVFHPSDEIPQFKELPLPEASVPAEVRDSLILDYRDPFLSGLVEVKPAFSKVVMSSPAAPGEDEPVRQPGFVFKGVIGNGDAVHALVSDRGTVRMVCPGDSVDGFLVVRFSPEKMTVKSNGRMIELKVR